MVMNFHSTLLRHHTHLHQHTFTHLHGGCVHSHTITHTHGHDHFRTDTNHAHRHMAVNLCPRVAAFGLVVRLVKRAVGVEVSGLFRAAALSLLIRQEA